MGLIASLMVAVGADVRPFQTGLEKVKAGLDETGGSANKFGALTSASGVLAAGAVTGIAAFGLAAVEHTEAAGQAAYEMSEKFGLLPAQASAWLSVGQQLGLTNEQISGGFKFVSKNSEAMVLALQATGKVPAALSQPYKDLGINVMDAGGHLKDANTLMLESADAFQAMPDGPEKAALAMKLFGRAGADLIPVLNQGRKGLEDMMAAGKASGAVMSGEQVEAAHKAFLAHQQLDMQVTGLTTRLGTALMPAMTAVTNLLSAHLTPALIVGGAVLVAAMIPAVVGWTVGIWSAIAAMLGAIPGVIAWTIATWAHVAALMAQAVAMVAAYWPILLIIVAIAAVVAVVILLVTHWDLVKRVTLQVWGEIKSFLGGVMSDIGGFFNRAVTRVISDWETVLTWFRNLPGNLLSAVSGFDNMLVGKGEAMIRGLIRGIQNMAGDVWAAIKSLIPGGADGPVAKALSAAGIPGFQFGGTVPGPIGAPMLALVHGGERITPADQVGGAGGGVTNVYVTVQGSVMTERELTLALRDGLRRLDREQR